MSDMEGEEVEASTLASAKSVTRASGVPIKRCEE